MELRKKIGFFLGPFLFLLLYFLPILSQNPKAHTLLSIFSLVVVWWVSECLPIPITSLLIPVFLVIFGLSGAEEAFAPFANPIIMLFMGSFIIARAMSLHGLDQKLAHTILSHHSIAGKRGRILFALGLTSALISLWVSNTATTAMMYPIALGILTSSRKKGNDAPLSGTFAISLLLTAAYASSLGGIGTPIGSPPNLIAISMLDKLASIRFTFFQWMATSFLAFLPMFLILYLFMKKKAKKDLSDSLDPRPDFPPPKAQGKGLTKGQKNVLYVFSLAVFLWILPGVVSLTSGSQSPVFLWLQKHIPESVVAVFAASLLFLLPVNSKRGEFTLTLKEGLKIDWGTLLLFGGGLSLGVQLFQTGLADAIGKFFLSLGGEKPSLALITLLSITFSVVLTEVASNTATASMVIPVIIAVCQAASLSVLPPVLGSAIGCSFAFMLPISTPPNAIVYGSGLIPLSKMVKYGFWLDFIGIFVIWLSIWGLAPLVGLL